MDKLVRIDNRSGLVLEGGGMRGVFTCGVLDNFMDRGIRFPYTIGVSAGACNGLSYMSGQRGRAKYSNIDLLEKYNYIGLKYLLKKRNIMDFDLLFREFPEHILPYDYDAYFSSPERFVMVTTNCLTGEANYFEEKQDKERVIDIVRASSSLPFVCPIVYVDNVPMLDGGIVDSIPLMHARKDGYTRNVVVLTKIFRALRFLHSFIRNTLICAKLSTGAVTFTTNSWNWWSGLKMRGKLPLYVRRSR